MVLISMRPVAGTLGADAYNEFKETLGELSDKLGSLVGVYDMAHAPMVLGVYDRFQQAISAHGTFDARTRSAIALTVAAVGDCADCRSAHTAVCRAAGWATEQIDALSTGAGIAGEEKITALLAVARQFAGDVNGLDKDTWRRALQAGWTIEELAELFTHVSTNIFANYLDHFTRDESDSSVNLPSRLPRITRQAMSG